MSGRHRRDQHSDGERHLGSVRAAGGASSDSSSAAEGVERHRDGDSGLGRAAGHFRTAGM